LLVAWRIGDGESPLGGRKEPVRGINRDPLLALVLEPVEQQGEIDIAAGRAEPSRFPLQCCELVVEHQRAIIEKAPDQCRLAVVDRTAGQET
jgi:hypothetical protein